MAHLAIRVKLLNCEWRDLIETWKALVLSSWNWDRSKKRGLSHKHREKERKSHSVLNRLLIVIKVGLNWGGMEGILVRNLCSISSATVLLAPPSRPSFLFQHKASFSPSNSTMFPLLSSLFSAPSRSFSSGTLISIQFSLCVFLILSGLHFSI